MTTVAVAFSVLGVSMQPPPTAAQESLETSLEFQVEPGAHNNSVFVAPASAVGYPRIAIDRDPASPRYGTIYVVGRSGPCGHLTVIRSFDGGHRFDEPIVTPLCLPGLTVDVVAGRNGTLFVAAWGPQFLRSRDGGLTWEVLATLGNASSHPSLALEWETNTLYLAWLSAMQWESGAVFVASSRDEGQTWTSPVSILPTEGEGNQTMDVVGSSPQIAAWGNSSVVGVIALDGPDYFVGAVSSFDRGETWGNFSAITDPDSCLRGTAISVAASRSGAFAISWNQDLASSDCWHDWGNTTQNLVSLSLDGGRTFSAPTVAGGPPGWPAAGFGDAFIFDDSDRMYATWHSIEFEWTSASVYVSNSSGPEGAFESASFTTRLQVAGGNSTAQENLALGLNDTVYLLWVAFDPEGETNISGIFIRAVAGDASGDVNVESPTDEPIVVEVRDATTGGVAFRGTWTGSSLDLAESPPSRYDVWVTVGNESSLSGQMPIRTWGRTRFSINVNPAGEEASPFPPLPFASEIGIAAVLVAGGGAVLIVLHHTRITRETALQREVRLLMFGFVRDHPGATFSEIRNAMGMQNGVAAYHLGVLERQGLLRSKRHRGRRRYFPEGDVTAWRNLPLSALQASLLDEIRRQPGIGVRELARTIDRRASSVAYNVKALVREGALRTERAGRKLQCYLSEDTARASPV